MFDISALSTLEIALIAAALAFTAGVVMSTKIMDLVKGVPADLRTALSDAEKATLAQVKTAKADVIAKVVPALPKLPVPIPVGKVALAPVVAAAVPAAPVVQVVAPVVPPVVDLTAAVLSTAAAAPAVAS